MRTISKNLKHNYCRFTHFITKWVGDTMVSTLNLNERAVKLYHSNFLVWLISQSGRVSSFVWAISFTCLW